MRLQRQDAATLTIFALIVAGIAWSTFQEAIFHPQATFGTEYGNLAENLALGHGFSGTFEVSRQASAWMPPLLPALIALIFLWLGIKTMASAVALLIVQGVLLCLSLAFLLLIASSFQAQRWPLAVVFTAYIAANRQAVFANFHDLGWNVLFSVVALYSLLKLKDGRSIKWPVACALLLPLASPSLALAFVGMTVLSRVSARKMAAVLACFLLSVSVWTARNAVALHGFVPIKSNLWFDFHQANVLDPDGVVADASFFRFHPALGSNIRVRRHYRDGELPFMAYHRQQAQEYVQQHPTLFFKKVLNRLANATWRLRPEQELGACAYILDAATQAYLAKRQLVVGSPGGVVWCSLDLEDEALKQQLSQLDPQQQERLYADWQRARAVQVQRRQEWDLWLWGLAHSLLPCLAIMIGLCRGSVRRQPAFLFAAGLYGVYLAPYIVVSHYVRYQVSLMGLAAFVVWLVVQKEPARVVGER